MKKQDDRRKVRSAPVPAMAEAENGAVPEPDAEAAPEGAEQEGPTAAEEAQTSDEPEAPPPPPPPPQPLQRRRPQVSRSRCMDDPWTAMTSWLTRACERVRALRRALEEARTP